jgi:hypothetical protein
MKDYSRLAKVSLEVQKDYNADVGRIERASRIVSNHEVRQISENRYAVQSQSKKAEYLVNADTVDCGCKDAESNHICKHFLAIQMYRALPDVSQTFDEWLVSAVGKIEIPKSDFFPKVEA